ncbi:MAG: YDG domain-containing protein [Leptospirales bacterium]
MGLIGELSGPGVVTNVGMTVPGGGSHYTTYSVQGGKSGQNLAALVGDNNGGTVALTQANLDITGTASGAQNIGTTVGLSSGLVMGDSVSGGPQVTKTTSSDTGGGDSIGGVVGRTSGEGLVFGATSFTGLLTATTNSSGTPTGGISADVGGVAGQVDGGVPTNQAGVYSYGVSSTNDPVGIVNSSGDGAYVTGWNGEIGGLVGASQNSIVGSQSTATVSGGGALLGGLLGGGWWGLEVVNSHATGNVTSNASGGGAGGLVGAFSGGTSGSLGSGYFYNALVQNSYAGGNVNGNNDSGNVGGLVGLTLSNTTVSSSYYGTNANSGGTVSGGVSATGGLVGANAGTIENSEVGLDYGIHVNGSQGSVGGLAGSNSGTVTDSYANANQSTSGATSGGLVGTNSGSVSYSFYNNGTSQTNNNPIGSSSGGTANDAIGIAASSFGSQSTFTSATSNNGNVNPSWNFSTVWIQGAHVPLLLGILPVETVTSSNASQIYSGSSSNNGAVITTSGWSGATSQNLASGSLSYSYGSGAPNAGSYAITPSGLTVNTSSFTTMHSGVGSIVYQNGTLLITPKALTVTVTDPTMVYNGTQNGTLSSSNVSISGWVGSEGATINAGSSAPTVTFSPTTGVSATPTVGSSNVGSDLTATASIGDSNLTANSGTNLSNYTLPASVTVNTGSITPAPLTLSTTLSRVYDGTANAALTGGISGNTTLSGMVSGQTTGAGLTSSGVTGTFSSTNVGSSLGGTVSPTTSDLTGNSSFASALSSGDYTLPTSFTGGSITPAPLTLTLASSVNKSYDTTSNAYLVSTATSETAGGLTQTVAPDVTVSGWVPSQGATFNGVIGSYLSGGSPVSSVGSGYTVTANVGASNFTNLLSGTTLSNYAINGTQLSGSNSTTLVGSGNITPAPLTLTLTTPTKTYDGTTSAYLTSASGGVSESAGGISQTVGPNATLSGFATGQGATVTATGTYTSGGSSVSNAGSGYGVSATVGTANFSSLLSGTTLSNYEIGGTQLTGSNTVTVSGTGGAINPAPLSLVLSNPSKTYDGTSTAFLTSSLETLTSSNISETIVPNATVTGFVTGQGASFAGTGSYATGSSSQTAPNVGSGYTVSASSLPGSDFTANSGTSLSNYTLPTSATGTGSITPAPLTVTLNNPTKTYDGTTTATLTSANTTVTGFAGSQSATLAASGNYLSPNANTNIGLGATVTGSDFTGSGGFVASNYAIGGTALSGSNSASVSGTGTINQALLTATGTQVYNGTTSFSGSNLTVSGVDGQSFAASGSGTLGSFGNVQTAQPLASVSGLTLTGLSGASLLNYQSFSPSDTTVSVTPAPLTVTVGSVSKTYDGTTTASLTSGNTTVSGFVSGQGATFSGASGTYSGTSGSNSAPDVGTGYTVSASVGASNFTNLLSGTSLSNYEIGSTQLTGTNTAAVSGTQGAITAAPLSLSTTATQTYNGSSSVSLSSANTTLSGMVSGQMGGLTSSGVTGTFASPNAGSNVGGTVSLSNPDLTGSSSFNSALSAGDYTLPATFTGGTITPAPLTLAITPSKVYDGTTTAYLTSSSGESVTAGGITQTIGSNVTVSGWVTPSGGTTQGATFNNATGTFSQSNAGSSLSFTAQLSSGSFTPNSGTTLSNYAIGGTQLSAGNTVSVTGTGSITPAPLTVTLSPTKVYDGSANAYLTSSGETVTTNGITQTIAPNASLSGFVTGQGAALSATGTYTSGGSSVSNVGSGYGVSASSESLTANSGTTLSNYAIGGTVLANGSNSAPLSGTGSITPASLTMTLGSVTKTYDASTTAYLTTSGETVTTNGITQTIAPNATVTGFVTGQGASFAGTGSYATGSSSQTAPNVGSGYTVSASGLPGSDFTANSGTSLSNYTLPTSATGTGAITPAPLTVTLAPAKTYDGTTTATLTSANTSVTGTVTGQSLTLSGASGSYASPNAGSEAVTANLGASDFTAGSGTSLSNYMLEGTPLSGTGTATVTGTGTIGKADLTAIGTQIYNGTTVFSGSNLTVTGVDGQSFTASGSGVLASANVQTGQNLSSVGGLALTGNGGALTSNYNPLATSQTSVTVSPDPILVSGSMVYNGTTTMPGSSLSAQAYLSSTNTSYTFSLTGNGILGNSGNVQTAQNLSSLGTLALSGTGSGNFAPTVSETSVTVTPAPLTVTLSPSKVYDGTTTATLTASNTSVAGFVSGQGAAFEGAPGTYSQSNVGSSLPVTADLSAGNFNPSANTAMSNYQISGTRMTGSNAATVSGTGSITPAVLSATGSQVYNGTTAFSGSNLTLTGGVDGQSFTASGSGTLGASGNVQTAQPLSSVSGITLTGAGGASTSNYTFGASNTSVSVTPAPLTLTLDTPTKTYDGTTTATLTAANTSLSGFVGGQGGTFNGASGTYQSANAGTGINVTAGVTSSDFTAASGTSLSNYQINVVQLSTGNTATVTGTGTITPANLTATGSQIYNGSTNFSGANLTVTGVDGQSFTAGGTGTLGSSGSVQTNQPLSSVSGITLTGNNGALSGNYNPLAPSQTSVTVTSAPIQISGSMVYNGTTTMPGTDLSAQAYLSGANFVFTLSGSGTLGNSGNVQSSQNLASMGTLALVGTGAGNFTPTVSETSVSVTPAPLSVTVGSVNKTYDGTTTATLTPSNTLLSGFITGQGATFLGATGTYQSANAGTGINVTAGVTASDFTPSGSTLLSNYQISGTPMTGSNVATVSGTGSIAPAPLSATGSQVYNGTTSFAGANLTLIGGVDGQSFTAGGTGTLGNSGNVQTAQPLSSVSGITLSGVSGANPANYTLGATNTQVSVTQAPLTLSLTTSPISKVYDGTSNAYLSSGSESVTTNGIVQSVSPNVTVSGFVSGQGATFSGAGSYSGAGAPNVGSGYAISSSGLSVSDFTNPLSGTLLSNYSLATTSLTGTGAITQAPVSVTGVVANNKVYDGTTGATLSNAGTLSGLVSGQSLTLSGPSSATFSTANVGSGLTVTASGYQIGNGTGLSSNYLLSSSLAQTTAKITPATLTLSTTASKVYDGSSSISLSGSDTSFAGFVAGQSGGLGTTVAGTLSQSAAGTNLGGTLSLGAGEMTGSSAFLSALSAGDYTLPASFTGGTITPAPTTGSNQVQATYGSTSNVTQGTAQTAQTAQTSAQATASSSASSTLGTSTSTGGLTSSGMSLASSGSSAGSVGGSTSGSSSGSSSSIGGSGTSVVDTTSSQFSGLVNSGTSGGSGSSGQASPQVSSLALTTGSLSFSVVGGGVSGGSSTVSIQGGGVSGGSSSGSSSLSVQGNGVSGGTSSGSSSLSVQGNGVSGGTSSGSSSLSVQGSGVSGSQGSGKTSTAP